MGFLKVDYDNTGDFAPLPIGKYECIVSGSEATKSKNSGAPMIKVKLTIREDVEQQGKKRTFFDNVVIQDNMMWKVGQVTKAAGLSQDEVNNFDTLEELAAALLYKPVVITNKHEQYNGETNDRVAKWSASELGGADGSDPMAGSGQIDISDDDLPF
jgi:hypothetical protein